MGPALKSPTVGDFMVAGITHESVSSFVEPRAKYHGPAHAKQVAR